MFIGSSLYYELLIFVVLLCIFIPLWVCSVMVWQIFKYSGICGLRNELKSLEFFWTVLPTFYIVCLCALNLSYLYYENYGVESLCIKVVGRQWYWSYEYPDSSMFDSIMGDFVSSVDKPLYAFYSVPCSLLVTSSDVIHSFSIPDLTIKADAVPGRVNWLLFVPDRLGVFVGYCTELCGAGHAYMPVVLEVLSSACLK